MSTTVQLQQDASYINSVRAAATSIISACNIAIIDNAEWNSLFGGSGRLGSESFTDSNTGLAKADIENAKNVLVQINAFLDSESVRGYLMAVANI